MCESSGLDNLTQPLSGALFGAAESPGWRPVQALEIDPEPVSAAGLGAWGVHAFERIIQAILALTAGEKWSEALNLPKFNLETAG